MYTFSTQLGNVEVMKVLAALGADVTLPDETLLDDCKRPSTLVHSTARNEGNQRTIPMLCTYMPTDEELYVYGWATGVHEAGLCDSSAYVLDSTPLIDSTPPENNDNMVTLLRAIGAVNTCRKPAVKCKHRHKSRVCGGASNYEPRHCIKKSVPHSAAAKALLLTGPGAPFLSLIPDGEITSDQAVEALKRLQMYKSERRKRGVCVLCLDGGGVKGLVELEILRQIEKKLGGGEITHLFDYIVGTSTGGIIALAMVYGEWKY